MNQHSILITHIYCIQKFRVGKIFLMSLKEVSYADQGCIQYIWSKIQ